MSSVLSSSDDSDFESTQIKLPRKAKRNLTAIDSEDDEGEVSIVYTNVDSNSPIKITTTVKPNIMEKGESGVEFVREAVAIGSPSKRRSGKRKTQLKILAFSQQKIRKLNDSTTAVAKGGTENTEVECPICYTLIPSTEIERHADGCADKTGHTTIHVLSQEPAPFGDFLDSDIFENDIDSLEHSEKLYSRNDDFIPVGNGTSSRKSDPFYLDNSFGTTATLTSAPKQGKRKIVSTTKKISRVELEAYPEINELTARGCLKNTGNNPGRAVQTFLKGTRPAPVVQSSEKESAQWCSSSFMKQTKFGGFKMHPFLAKTSSTSLHTEDASSLAGAVIPDGDGGFVINDEVLDSHQRSSDEDVQCTSGSCSFPMPMAGGFIDFENQFKEHSIPRPRKPKPKRSPKKKTWKSFKRGRGRGRRRG